MFGEKPFLVEGARVNVGSDVFSWAELSVKKLAEWVEVLLSVITATVVTLSEEGYPLRKGEMG